MSDLEGMELWSQYVMYGGEGGEREAERKKQIRDRMTQRARLIY